MHRLLRINFVSFVIQPYFGILAADGDSRGTG